MKNYINFLTSLRLLSNILVIVLLSNILFASGQYSSFKHGNSSSKPPSLISPETLDSQSFSSDDINYREDIVLYDSPSTFRKNKNSPERKTNSPPDTSYRPSSLNFENNSLTMSPFRERMFSSDEVSHEPDNKFEHYDSPPRFSDKSIGLHHTNNSCLECLCSVVYDYRKKILSLVFFGTGVYLMYAGIKNTIELESTNLRVNPVNINTTNNTVSYLSFTNSTAVTDDTAYVTQLDNSLLEALSGFFLIIGAKILFFHV